MALDTEMRRRGADGSSFETIVASGPNGAKPHARPTDRRVAPGELVAMPACGAYCLPMSSSYNGALRPAVVVVEAGRARLVQRRQTLDDLLACECP